jgi:hypothetical protein
VEPLFQRQLKQQEEQWIIVVKALQNAGLFASSISGKKKEGYLYMLKTEGHWRKYYWVLLKDSMVYFQLTEKVWTKLTV